MKPKESTPWNPDETAKKLSEKYHSAFQEVKGTAISWGDCGAEDLLAAVAHVTEDGVALLLAKTSDGGALMVQALIGSGHKPKFYAASQSELNELLATLARI